MGNSTPIPEFEKPLQPEKKEGRKWSLFTIKQSGTPWGFIIIPWVFIAVLITLWFTGKFHLSPKEEDKESILITRIETMGKLELVKYHLKDVFEHKMVRQWFPDPTALLIIGGEAVGCIDLTKIQKKDIQIQGDSLTIHLPKAEVCYVKINHNESKVYSTQFAFWDEAKLVDEAYQDAEKQLSASVSKSDILVQTQNTARLILTPLFQSMGYKSVKITY